MAYVRTGGVAYVRTGGMAYVRTGGAGPGAAGADAARSAVGVEPERGLEPLTCRLQGGCSAN